MTALPLTRFLHMLHRGKNASSDRSASLGEAVQHLDGLTDAVPEEAAQPVWTSIDRRDSSRSNINYADTSRITRVQAPGSRLIYTLIGKWFGVGAGLLERGASGCIPAVRTPFPRTTAGWPVILQFRRLRTSRPGSGVRLW